MILRAAALLRTALGACSAHFCCGELQCWLSISACPTNWNCRQHLAAGEAREDDAEDDDNGSDDGDGDDAQAQKREPTSRQVC